MSFKIQKVISDERVEDLLICGLEGGIGYWSCVVEKSEHDWYDFNSKGWFILFEDTEVGNKQYRLDKDSLQKGLDIMQEKYPRHFTDFLREDEDAETGDVFCQCCLLGEVIYG